jgi:CubicO group peptidase (beta-lactamase class C family)
VTAVDPLPIDLRDALERQLRERGVRGAVLCAFDTDRICFAGGAGLADLRRGEPVGPATIFRVASISKLLTATLVLELASQGLLDLDAPVDELLPPDLRILDPDGRPATSSLRSLLSHSSGLPAGIRGAQLANPVISYLANQGRVRDLGAAIEGLRLTHAPESKVVYSNPGYNVAGYLAARALGTSFEDAASDRVLGPVGMHDSRFAATRTGRGVATHYGRSVPPRVGPRPVAGLRLVATPMGGLTTNVVDLARFGQMVLAGGATGAGRLLDTDTVRTATSVRATNHPRLTQGYGLGFRVREWEGRTLIGHDGNMPGVATQLVLSPSDGIGVVVLTNGYALSIPHQVAELTLRHLLDLPGAGAPAGSVMSAGSATSADEAAAAALGCRAEGSYRLCDTAPPGVIGAIDAALTRVRVHHETNGVLRIEGAPGSDGAVRLLPDGHAGHFRVSAPVDHGTDAVVEERSDGTHIWWGFSTHLHRARRSPS